MRTCLRLLSAIAALAVGAPAAVAEPCAAEQFRKVVDDSGAALRRLNAESKPRIDLGLRRLKERQGWSEEEHVEKANVLLSDAKSDAYDAAAGELLAKLDRLAEEPATGKTDCARLAELEATALELQATIRVKTQYMLARLEALTGAPPGPPSQAEPAKPAPTGEPPRASAAAEPPARASPAPAARPAPPPAAAAPAPAPALPPQARQAPPSQGWSTSTVTQSARPLPPLPPPAAGPPQPAPTPAPAMPPMPADPEGFSQDEIREASRGFFGTLSAGLAGVIEHAFGQLGRPSAYVLGNEGGGAFIAGVRYGKGTLFLRGGRSREVYWHGPSIGYDFGASGSKTLFLVYNLRDELDIFAGFSGVDGSAYLVGGVGMTVLTDGKVVMAPIRSGVGLRLGASVGYVRFTARATWNPF